MAVNYGQAVIAAAQMFLDKVVRYPYIMSKFSILAMSNNVEYSLYGESTNVREVTAGKAINYDENVGFEDGGDNGSVVWSEFKAMYDRQKTFKVPFIKEVNSILAGMEPSTVALLEQWWRAMGEEIDACIATSFYADVPTENRLLDTVNKVDEDNVFNTCLDIKWKIYNGGVDDDIYFFVSSDVVANMQKKILNGYGLANPTVLTMNPIVSQDVADRVGEGGLTVDVNIIKFADNCYIIPVPENRMVTKIVLNDGKTGGQEEGGWSAATEESGYAKIKILAIPKCSAFVAIRHLVSNLTVPANTQGILNVNAQLEDLNNGYYGSATVQNIGIDQTGDWFKSMNRIKHGGGVFETYKHTIFSVTTTPKV